MHTDHADANLLYAKVYGHLWAATAARLVALDTAGMDLDVTGRDRTPHLRIAFAHCLPDVAVHCGDSHAGHWSTGRSTLALHRGRC